jgi:hypothetical protein
MSEKCPTCGNDVLRRLSGGVEELSQVAALRAQLAAEKAAHAALQSDFQINVLDLEHRLAAEKERADKARADALEEAANCVDAPPVGSIRHDIGKPFTLWGFTPRSLQEDLAKAVRALAARQAQEKK